MSPRENTVFKLAIFSSKSKKVYFCLMACWRRSSANLPLDGSLSEQRGRSSRRSSLQACVSWKKLLYLMHFRLLLTYKSNIVFSCLCRTLLSLLTLNHVCSFTWTFERLMYEAFRFSFWVWHNCLDSPAKAAFRALGVSIILKNRFIYNKTNRLINLMEVGMFERVRTLHTPLSNPKPISYFLTMST